jgi:hypothetical protein
MPPREVAWRVKSTLRDMADYGLLAGRQRPRSIGEVLAGESDGQPPPPGISDLVVGEWSGPTVGQTQRQWRDRLLAKADRIAAHRLDFFDLRDRHLGDPIDWNRDHSIGKAAPMRFSPWIDYRDVDVTGDCKLVWEPNRHHQLVVLGRAYRAGGDIRYAQAVVEQLSSWLDQCPYGVGMNWRSPLELGIRLINWVWALDLIRPSGLVAGRFHDRLIDSVDRHIWEIDRKYSAGSAANNHLIGEAAGVYIASSCFPFLKRARQCRARSRDILCQCIFEQVNADGSSREQATGYHMFVTQFFLLSALAGRWTKDEFPPDYWARLEKMFEFLGMLGEGGQSLPMLGDGDDGYVLDLGDDPRAAKGWLSAAAILFGRGDFKGWSGGYREPARWLLGRDGQQRFDAVEAPAPAGATASGAFPDSGLYLLQSGHSNSDDRISAVFDCGEHGFRSIAAHAHADALSFVLRVFGEDVLVDPGTYDYFSHPAWRSYFRSTRAHNTVVIDGKDQSEMLGSFLWGKRASSRCLSWRPDGSGGEVIGEHDGYTRLSDPVTHRRSLQLDGKAGALVVKDDIMARGRHNIEVCFHLAEQCVVSAAGENRFIIDVGPGTVTLELDPRLDVTTLVGSDDPTGGWVSRGYHRKTPSTTLIGRAAVEGNGSLTCRVCVGALKSRQSLQVSSEVSYEQR